MHPKVTKAYLVQERHLFYCRIRIKIPAQYSESLLNACFERLEWIDRRYNAYQYGSYFEQINRYAGQWVQVDQACLHMLHTTTMLSAITQGSYDITCMPWIRLWGFYKKIQHTIPTADAIAGQRARVNYKNIEIQGHSVRIAKGQEICTGSFIKAYAVDQAIAFLKSNGVTDALINAGGSTIIGINDRSHDSWKIHIPSAFTPGEYTDRLELGNQCFSLSGRLNSQVTLAGKSFGHIVNSKTGYPATTAQVGLLTDTAFLGDVLSTALFTVDAKAFIPTLESLQKQIDFRYYRLEADGQKISNICF